MRLKQYNLIESEEHEDRIVEMRERLFERLEETDGMQIPLRVPRGGQQDESRPEGEPSTDPLRQ